MINNPLRVTFFPRVVGNTVPKVEDATTQSLAH